MSHEGTRSSISTRVALFSSLDKDQIKVVIDEVTRWLDLAEEGDWMTLPGITGRQRDPPRPGSRALSHARAWGQPSSPGDPGHQPSRQVLVVAASHDFNSEVEGPLF